MIGRKTGLAIFLILVLAGSLFAVHAARSTDAAVPYAGAGAVGALVILDHNKITRPPFCTAAVVRSPAGNLLVTAAHCLGRVPVSVMAFVPGYQGGSSHFRYGVWRVVRQTFPAHWFPAGNIRRDFAFLTVRGNVQAKVGAETLGTSSPVPASVQVIGYTLDGHPATCTEAPTTVVAAGQRQLRFTCKGYVSAASGAPFLVNVSAKTGNGTVIGVIGGYQQGGDSPSISYSSPFGATVKALYRTATAPAAVPYDGAGAVGALVILDHNKITRPPFCTAAVVRSPAGNLLVTAAHCLGRVPVSVMAFVPGYRGGSGHFRYGLWRVVRQTFPAHWFPGGNIKRDFAFLTVRSDVQAKVGAETLGTSSPAPASVQVIGYTLDGHPVICTRPATTIAVRGQRQLKFTCDGYEASASGAPFLVNVSAKTGNGTIIGVIGGYQQGGDTPSISYSSPFGATIRALYRAVVRKG